MDIRLVIYAAWALGSVIVWGRVLSEDWGDYRRIRRLPFFRDRRSQSALRELLSDLALFLVAFASAASILTLVIGQEVPGLRGFALALALGGFLGAGVVKATVRRAKP